MMGKIIGLTFPEEAAPAPAVEKEAPKSAPKKAKKEKTED